MNALKEFVAEKLIQAGFKPKNIFYTEPLAKKELLKNSDSVCFYEENASGELSEKGYGANIEGDLVSFYKRKLAYNGILRLRLFMQKETLYSRLSSFYDKLCDERAPRDLIVRVAEEQESDTIYYELSSLKERIDKEVKVGVIEVLISFSVTRYKIEKGEYPTINDLSVSASIKEV